MATDLLLIAPGFPADEEDSTCIPPLQGYLRALREARPGWRIAVIATQYPPIDRPYSWHGISVHPCNGRNKWYRKPGTWGRAAKALEELRAAGDIRALHSLWLGECAMLASKWAKALMIPHVLTLMGRDARDGARWWRRIQRPTSVVCLTERHAVHFRHMSGTRADAIVPWGINGDSKAPYQAQRDIDVLWCGSFAPVKRPALFLDVIAQFPEQPAPRTVMVGQGATAFFARRRSGRGAPMERRGITVMDALPRGEVLKLMQRSKVLVHTSSYESQGYVFDEALINGMSIVSDEVGSARPGARWRIASEPASMAAAVGDLLRNAPANDSTVPHPMSDTVSAYLDLYGLA